MSLWPLIYILATIVFVILYLLVICYKSTKGFLNLSWDLLFFAIISKTIKLMI